MENIAGGVRAPSVVRSLESASATGTWRHATEMFSTFYGVLMDFLNGDIKRMPMDSSGI